MWSIIADKNDDMVVGSVCGHAVKLTAKTPSLSVLGLPEPSNPEVYFLTDVPARQNGRVRLGVKAQLGGGRFTIERRLGSGGMGVVYAVLDHRRNATVALKTLKSFDPEGLFRFKNEFRALADLVHPNLVTLHELVSFDGQWAFTMDIVEGVDFVRYVRPLPQLSDAAAMVPLTSDSDSQGEPTRPVRPSSMEVGVSQTKPARLLGPLNLIRLRESLSQLVQGILFLHAAGKLHRDVKPSNILVTEAGRVVLCDFGLVTEVLAAAVPGLAHHSDGSGTPEYMAPEQMDGASLSEASDWYAVGALLYHCLVGGPPFRGSTDEIRELKRAAAPPAPSNLIPGTPPDLEALCVALLQRDPKARPTGREILRALGVEPDRALPRPLNAPFVGREGALRTLHSAFAEARRGTPRAVLIHATSGMGKSALAGRFLEEVRAPQRALVLASRCYERESVPYKAVDGLVDALVAHLLSRPPDEPAIEMPENIGDLIRLFPVMRQVPALSKVEVERVDSIESRRRAFTALRKLLLSLAKRWPLVLLVDDLQWGDGDSASLIAHLFRGADAPPALFVGCYRTEDTESSPMVQALLHPSAGFGTTLEVEQLALSPLAPDESRRLVEAILGTDASIDDLRDFTEAGAGNPYLLDELVRFQGSRPASEPPGADRLTAVLRTRLDALPEPARKLMDAVALAGGPIPRSVAAAAAEVSQMEPALLAQLRSQRLVRVRVEREIESLEPYHDRIRETSRSALPEPERVSLHRKLALAYEAAGGDPWEMLYGHWLGAGEPEPATRYAVLAARRAMEALAFDRAVVLYRAALRLSPTDTVRAQLGDALAAAGHGAEAAAEYLVVARHAPEAEARRLNRLAVEQWFGSGRVEEGMALLKGLLEEVGERFPSTPRQAIRSLLLDRFTLWVRGLDFDPAPGPVDPDIQYRLSLLQTVNSLTFIDPLLATAFHNRRLVLALRSGDQREVAWELLAEAVSVATRGNRHREQMETLWRRVNQMAAQLNDPALALNMFGTRGLMLHCLGDWREGSRFYHQAALAAHGTRSGARWVELSAAMFGLLGLAHLGDFAELTRKGPLILADALEKGDVYSETSVRVTIAYLVSLGAGDSVGARAHLRIAAQRWVQKGFHIQHYHRLHAETKVDLYEGDAANAYRRIVELRTQAKRVYMDRVELLNILGGHLHGLAALALARIAPERKRRLVKEAHRWGRTIVGYDAPWAEGIGLILSAGAAAQCGHSVEAIELAGRAVDALESNDMPYYAAGARWRRGQALGGTDGDRDVAQAREWFTRQGVKDPERLLEIVAPDLR